MFDLSLKSKNFVSLVQKIALHSPQKIAYIFLEDGSAESARITYGELDKKARAVAAYLQNKNLFGERILLLFPTGLDFIIAFIGCLYAGVVSVSVPASSFHDIKKRKEFIDAVIKDANIVGILTVSSYIEETKKHIVNFFSENQMFLVDITNFDLDASVIYRLPKIFKTTIAFLQYTSGSTSLPKAAVIEHEQLWFGLKNTAKKWHYNEKSITLTWSPHSHTYGLICGLLVPLYSNSLAILISPEIFVVHPVSWLKAITKYQVTHSGCPNFGYEFCVNKIREDELIDINLSSWKVAINGGENIQYETLEKFFRKFSRFGFRFNCFCPAYGMSELVGAISSNKYEKKPTFFSLSIEELKNNKVVLTSFNNPHAKFVSTGYLLSDLEVVIVDPDTCLPVGKRKIGEIWLRGKAFSKRYWKNLTKTSQSFYASTPKNKKYYFRTGDLGFIEKGELCITGRLKELIILYGKKYYPLDLENTVAAALKNLTIDNRLVFSLLMNKKEEIVFIQEVNDESKKHYDEIIKIIRTSILEKYGLDVYSIVLVEVNSIPKTASGKLKRQACQEQFLEKKLAVVKEFIKENLLAVGDESKKELTKSSQIERKNTLSKLFYPDFIQLIASTLDIDESNINLNSSLSEYKIDSINIIKLITELKNTYNFSITAASLFEYSTLIEFFDDLLVKYADILNSYYQLDIPVKLQDAKLSSEFTEDLNSFEQENSKRYSPEFFEEEQIASSNEIAIIGMNGIFPGADNLNTFWENLVSGKDVITEIPKNRLGFENYYKNLVKENDKDSLKWGGFVEDIFAFDASFFNISPREAELLDPQHRIFLQSVWKTIEDAGYRSSDLAKISTGVFVGVFNHDYAELLNEKGINDAYFTTGTTHSILANRVSYLLNLHGPSVAIDTACSSSLVAIHYAVKAIQNGDCDMAIAGGVNALLSPISYLSASKAGMLSKEGRCKTFDKEANGYVRAEGVGAILLKSLSKAITDGDHIYGVIKGTAINHGGHVNTLVAPNPHAQADVIISACRKANVTVDSIAYIEVHGTGTSLGDPIEINGLKKAFSILSQEEKIKLSKHYCGLSSLKTHIGHLESAAGIASVIKVLLTMQHKKIPGNLHFKELNPEIDISESPFYIIDKTKDFIHLKNKEDKKIPYRVGISSFGFGGANAHIIIEESPAQKIKHTPQLAKKPYIIALSAKTSVALEEKITHFHEWLSSQIDMPSLSELSFTLNVGREHFKKRCVLVVDSIEDFLETLNLIKHGQKPKNFIFHTEDVDKTLSQPVFQELFKQLLKELCLMIENIDRSFSISEFKSKLLGLSNFYVEGYEVDWEKLYSSEEKKRISLPTYPFSKENYGISFALKKHQIETDSVVHRNYSPIPISDFYREESSRLDQDPISQKKILKMAEEGIVSLEIIQNDLKYLISKILKTSLDAINIKVSLNELGLDSITLKELAIELEDYYNISLNPSLFFTYQTIENLSEYLLNTYSPFSPSLRLPHAMPARNDAELDNPDLNHFDIKKSKEYSLHLESEPIAIIGMQGFFPQSKDLEEFWKHLEQGDDLVTEIPIDRWDWHAYYGDIKQNDDKKTNSKWGAFLNEVASFDAAFFNISPHEANLMDPRHRLFMEIVWKTIEDAGYDPTSLSKEETGLFVGIERNEYYSLLSKKLSAFDSYATTGNADALLANRISYFLNLQGPSEVINTACSSSLVAVHRAVNALRQGECSVAIAGGVNLILDPNTFVVVSQLGILSSDGRCKTFDKNANGYVKGEGVGAILLKSVKKAKIDGDHIYGVIKGSAVAHSGKAQSLTAPNAVSQKKLLLKVFKEANISPETITYIEVHGTGTELGDPVEIEGLKLAFEAMLDKPILKSWCGLGSVKTNIGHLEPASGIAGIIKVLLSMKHQKIPKNLHFKNLNPYIDIKNSPFYIMDKLQIWERLKDENKNEIPYRAGVSSFGLGGTIAHILIEEAPIIKISTEKHKPYYVITLSAKEEKSLKQKIYDLYFWIENHLKVDLKSNEKTRILSDNGYIDIDLAALSFTLNVGRTHFNTRCAFIISSFEELQQSLKALINEEPSNSYKISTTLPTYFNNLAFSEIYHSVIDAIKNNGYHLTCNIYREKLELLTDLYIQHYAFDWDIIYSENEKKRIPSLPSYPFIKKYFWFDKNEEKIVEEKNNGAAEHNEKQFIEKRDDSIETFTLAYLQKIFSEKVKLPPDQIEFDTTYEIYGIDSLLGIEIIHRLEKDFGTLSKTLLYEKNKLRELAEYLEKNFSETLKNLYRKNNVGISVDKDSSSEKTQKDTSEKMMVNPPKQNNGSSTDIAIIGLSGVYPMAKDIDELWLNLLDGRNCITEIPLERWNYQDYPVEINGEKKCYKYGGFIADVDKFDPLFFNISPRDASLMDPQERLFLQSAWTTLEDAGYTRERLQFSVNNEVGVFVGATYNFYPLFIAHEWQKGNKLPLDIQMFSMANRVSYFFNLKGPSYVVDTACSSSLSAIHLAYESLVKGECLMAIAGGVNLSLHPYKYHFLGSYGFLSEKGECASFAEGGSGYVPSEGVGSILLKPLSLAIKDHDRIYGIIKGSHMNHGGKTSGYTVPNPNAQVDLIKKTLKKAKINARTISYVEAHGTGTALGDPIEVNALKEAFEEDTKTKQFCAIASVKSNIGHLEAAAGISQVTKVLLQMRYKKLVPSLHAEHLNPYINFSDTPFFVQQHLNDWQSFDSPRRAGISSFGAGGTNVHLIMEEFILPEDITNTHFDNDTVNSSFLFLLSAKNTERLQEYAKNVRAFLIEEERKNLPENEKNKWLRQLCYTSQVGRESMTAKLAIIAFDYYTLIEKLTTYLEFPEQLDNSIWVTNGIKPNEINDLSSKNLSELLQKNAYEELVKLWINGTKIPWQTLYKNQIIETIFFPTYPFEKRRCWVSKEFNSFDKKENYQGERSFQTSDFQTDDVKAHSHVDISSKNEESAALVIPSETSEPPRKVGMTTRQKYPLEMVAEKIIELIPNNQVLMKPSPIQLDFDEINDLVTNIFSKSLELAISEIDPNLPFQNYGLDSMTGIQFISELSKQFIGKLSPMDLYRYPTIHRLTEHIIKTCQLVAPTINVPEASLSLPSDTFLDIDDNNLLTEILNLSNEEIIALLEKEMEIFL